MQSRPEAKNLVGKDAAEVPMSLQRVIESTSKVMPVWVGPKEAAKLKDDELKTYETAHKILCHLAIRAPYEHKSGHPGGPLSAFTMGYWIHKMRDPSKDQPLRFSAGHLSVLSYGLQWLFGRGGDDERLSSPHKIIETFRIPNGLPGHVEAGIGDIPFGTGPLGKGVSNALGVAFGLKYQKKKGLVDVILADGDSQEGQVMEAFRLASELKLDNLVVHGDFNDIQLSGLPSKTVAADFSALAHACGWQVIEVQNGNDPAQVKAALETAEKLRKDRPTFICYYTTMGYGVSFMEEGSNKDTKNFHGAPVNDEEYEAAMKELPDFEELIKEYQSTHDEERKRYEKDPVETDVVVSLDLKKAGFKREIMEEKGAARKEFGALHMLNAMKADDRIVVLHADLAGSGGFNKVEAELPDRCINVGVAEANMFMMAAGMRQTGLLPVTYTFAAFATYEARANARLIDINCGHTRCGVLHDATHAGLSVGEDGETHQERNYLNIPLDHTQVWMSADSNQAGAMAERGLEIIAEGHESVFTFFPRSGHEQLKSPDGNLIYGADYTFDGKIDLIRGTGTVADHLTIIATGIPVHDAVEAADQLAQSSPPVSVRVLNCACVRPIDASAVIQAALETGHILVVEDHHSEGGLATQVADIIADFNLPCTLRRLGVNHYFPSGSANDLKFLAGLDAESIADAAAEEARTEFCGGADALVSAISELIHNLNTSRFRESAQSFAGKLLTEDGYLDALREYWEGRECPAEKLPSNEALLQKLQQSQLDGV